MQGYLCLRWTGMEWKDCYWGRGAGKLHIWSQDISSCNVYHPFFVGAVNFHTMSG
jgi:hypothetical protein